MSTSHRTVEVNREYLLLLVDTTRRPTTAHVARPNGFLQVCSGRRTVTRLSYGTSNTEFSRFSVSIQCDNNAVKVAPCDDEGNLLGAVVPLASGVYTLIHHTRNETPHLEPLVYMIPGLRNMEIARLFFAARVRAEQLEMSTKIDDVPDDWDSVVNPKSIDMVGKIILPNRLFAEESVQRRRTLNRLAYAYLGERGTTPLLGALCEPDAHRSALVGWLDQWNLRLHRSDSSESSAIVVEARPSDQDPFLVDFGDPDILNPNVRGILRVAHAVGIRPFVGAVCLEERSPFVPKYLTTLCDPQKAASALLEGDEPVIVAHDDRSDQSPRIIVGDQTLPRPGIGPNGTFGSPLEILANSCGYHDSPNPKKDHVASWVSVLSDANCRGTRVHPFPAIQTFLTNTEDITTGDFSPNGLPFGTLKEGWVKLIMPEDNLNLWTKLNRYPCPDTAHLTSSDGYLALDYKLRFGGTRRSVYAKQAGLGVSRLVEVSPDDEGFVCLWDQRGVWLSFITRKRGITEQTCVDLQEICPQLCPLEVFEVERELWVLEMGRK